MSVFESTFASGAAPSLMALHGRDAVYSPPRGDAVSGIKAMVEAEQVEARSDKGRGDQLKSATVKVLQTACTPKTGGRFAIDEREVWTIVRDPIRKDGFWICRECTREATDGLNRKRMDNA